MRSDAPLTIDDNAAHGLQGGWEKPDWPPLTVEEVDRLLRSYPAAGGADRLLTRSPRPFSSASVVATPGGPVFVKRHHSSVRDVEGLLEEHRFLAHLAAADWPDGELLVAPVLMDGDGATAVALGEWSYEVHGVALGIDVYQEALSWTPFLHTGHAWAAGRALAGLHHAAVGFEAPPRAKRPLVTSFSIFAGEDGDPERRMRSYLEQRPLLLRYAEQRDWQRGFDTLFMPMYDKLAPWLGALPVLWTHNDFHASNLTWSGAGTEARVAAIMDFGLADRTNAVHDLATAIERNIVEWLRMEEAGIVHLDQLDALLAGYESLRPLGEVERRALVAMLPLVHCEFALSETDYFLRVLHSEEKARLAYEGYFVAHAAWFQSADGKRLLEHLKRWADRPASADGGAR